MHAAVDAGADAIGLVFYDKSPRYVDVARAAALAEQGYAVRLGKLPRAARSAVPRATASINGRLFSP